MVTETLYPASVGTNDTWILDTGSDKTTAVQTNDGDTSRIRRGGAIVLEQDFDVDNSSLGSGDTINSVTAYGVVKSPAGGPFVELALQLPGGAYLSNRLTCTTGYTTVSKAWATNPDTSSAWVLDDIDGTYKFEIGIRNYTTGYIYYCTQLYIEIDYTEATDGAPPLVNGGLVNSGLVGGRLIG